MAAGPSFIFSAFAASFSALLPRAVLGSWAWIALSSRAVPFLPGLARIHRGQSGIGYSIRASLWSCGRRAIFCLPPGVDVRDGAPKCREVPYNAFVLHCES